MEKTGGEKKLIWRGNGGKGCANRRKKNKATNGDRAGNIAGKIGRQA